MRKIEILLGLHIWSCQNNSSWILLIFFSPSQYETKNNCEYIKWPFSIVNFERYVNSKSDYLELLLSVQFYTEIISKFYIWDRINYNTALYPVHSLWTSYVLRTGLLLWALTWCTYLIMVLMSKIVTSSSKKKNASRGLHSCFKSFVKHFQII